MIKIDYSATQKNAFEHLKMLTKYLSTGCYSIHKVPIAEIEETTNLKNLLKINTSTKYDQEIVHDLEIMSRLEIDEKRILYCVHLLGIKLRNLRSDSNQYEYCFGNSYKNYDKAVLSFGMTQEKFIAYLV